MMMMLLFIMMVATCCMSLATALQVAACDRPFRNRWERVALLIATLFWAWRAGASLWLLVAGEFPAELHPGQFILNWLGAFALVFAIWAGLGRFEKIVQEKPQKSAMWKKGQCDGRHA